MDVEENEVLPQFSSYICAGQEGQEHPTRAAQ